MFHPRELPSLITMYGCRSRRRKGAIVRTWSWMFCDEHDPLSLVMYRLAVRVIEVRRIEFCRRSADCDAGRAVVGV